MKRMLLLASVAFSVGFAARAMPQPQTPRPYLAAALGAARWLEHHAVETKHGVAWAVAPGSVERQSADLYNGYAGVVLFLCDLFRVTEDARWRTLGIKGADALRAAALAPMPNGRGEDGLYTGLAGQAFVLDTASDAFGTAHHREAADRVRARLIERAKTVGGGIEWNDTTDIIRGSAGIGLYLLHAAATRDDKAAERCAIAAGRRLVEVATKTAHGLDWFMTPKYPRRMPNFSHGTAGVCYFLAALHERTGKRVFLEAARKGAAHLVALTDGGLVCHHQPGGESLFYLGWCHGPPGTARLYRLLERVDKDGGWRQKIAGLAEAIRKTGVPRKRTPGYWNNVGVCCGAAGVAAFLADAAQHLDAPAHRELAREITDDVLARADRTDDRWRWRHAEHRTRPKLLRTYTGLMQGAAGIGRWLLEADRITRRDADDASPRPVRLPDDPWGRPRTR